MRSLRARYFCEPEKLLWKEILKWNDLRTKIFISDFVSFVIVIKIARFKMGRENLNRRYFFQKYTFLKGNFVVCLPLELGVFMSNTMVSQLNDLSSILKNNGHNPAMEDFVCQFG